MDPTTNGHDVTNEPEPAGGVAGRMTAEEALLSFGPRPAVTRVSPRAVLAIGGAAAGLGLIVLVAGLGGRPTPARRESAPAEEAAPRPGGPAEPVRDLPADYAFATPVAGPATTRPAGDGSPESAAVTDTRRQLAELRERLTEAQRKDQAIAFDSPVVFGLHTSARPDATPAADAAAGTTAAATPAHSPAVLPADVAGLLAAATPSGTRPAPAAVAGGGQPPEKAAFLTAAAAVEPYVHKPLLSPASPYKLKAGTVIPGALVTGVNTDLPGDVIGQVTENVYDSATGRYLLVPQGSRLLGRYQALVGNGQNRALLAWQRLVYPDGRSIELEAMPGTDAAGAAGLADRVDYHLDKLAAATALSTAIAYGGNLARNRSAAGGYGGYSNGDVIGDTVAQQADRVGSKIIDRQLDVQPTITVRPGWPFRVLVNKDVVLAPYGDHDADGPSPHHRP